MNQVIHHYHAAAGLPTKARWLKAIKAGVFTLWPMLTATAAAKHFIESHKTQQGHMRQQHKGIQSMQDKTEAYDTHIVHTP